MHKKQRTLKTKRTKIPEWTKLKLWVLSGGRCEFSGCNNYIWRDGLTLQEDNFAEMAHIIAQSSDGPRGNKKLSLQQAIDFENLIMLCPYHHKLVDKKNKNKYPVELLKRYKQKHEARIKNQTDAGDDVKTTIIRFMANIGERKTEISLSQTEDAITPRWRDEGGVLFDYTNKSGSGDKAFWNNFLKEIDRDVKNKLTEDNTRQRFEHLSVFAMGPIPILMRFGNQLGNIISVNLYQKHRDTDNWTWKPEDKKAVNFNYIVHKPQNNKKAKKVALILSLSGKIQKTEIKRFFQPDSSIYEITIPNPEPTFLNQRSKLEKFKSVYRNLITNIRAFHGSKVEIHIFPAIPAPIAVLCGKELVPKSDPKVYAYDNNKDKGGFIYPLKIN